MADYSDLGINALTRELDRTKSELYAKPYATFYGSLLCSLNFFWTSDMRTAATDGVNLMWNPHWFMKLEPRTRVTVLMHEIQHPARLHFMRQGTRNGLIWNYACDISINNRLKSENYSFEGLEWAWMNNKDLNFPLDAVEEDIFDALMALNTTPPSTGAWGQNTPPDPSRKGDIDPDFPDSKFPDDGTDMFPSTDGRPMTKDEQARAVSNVIRASQQAQIGGDGLPGDVEVVLKQFLAPTVPWEQFLHRFMQGLTEGGFTWRLPNRRYQSIYLPSKFEDEGALDHLAFYEDTSGSISDKDSLRFNSEFKYVKETYKPKKMTLIQFDSIIQNEITYLEEDLFNQILIGGRGGTSLACVREHILKHRPTAVVVFSDLQCEPMLHLGFEIPILWVVINNKDAQVPFGKVIHIR
jgi:predicted metal-dependent peptidase